MRTSRSNGTKTYNYVYNGSQLTQMTVGSDTLYFTYGLLGPTTVTWNGVTYYYALNGQGDVTGIFDPDGILVVTYNWNNAWGCNPEPEGTMASTLGTLNPLRYRSYVYDEETELYYLQSRYYNPEIGRFINADNYTTTGQGLTGNNMFAYCGNNPVSRLDDGGDFWHIIAGAAIGAVISFATSVVSDLIAGEKVDWAGAGISAAFGAASGALASTGVGLVGMVAGNAAISMAENATNQVIANKGFNNFDVGDMLTDGVIGGISGSIGGAGKGSKHLTNLGKQTVKRTVNATVNKGVKAGLKEAGKAFAYYGKNTVKYYNAFLKGLPGEFFSTVATTIASSNYMKYQYRRLIGR